MSVVSSIGFIPVASNTVAPELPVERKQKPQKLPEDLNTVAEVARLTPPDPVNPPESKRMGGPTVTLFVSENGMTAIYAVLWMQRLDQAVAASLTPVSILYAALDYSWTVDPLVVRLADAYLGKDIKSLIIPKAATDAEIAKAKAENRYDEKELIHIDSTSRTIAMDTMSRFKVLKHFNNAKPFTVRGYLIQDYVDQRKITLNRHPDDIEDIAAAINQAAEKEADKIPPFEVRDKDETYDFLKIPQNLYLCNVRQAIEIFSKQTRIIAAA